MRAEKGDAEAGFTVLEVAIALAILALSLGVLYRSGATSLTVLDRADRQSIALMIAESRLAEFRATAGEAPRSGEDPSGLRWEIVASPTPSYAHVRNIRIDVYDPNDTAAPMLTLESAVFHAH